MVKSRFENKCQITGKTMISNKRLALKRMEYVNKMNTNPNCEVKTFYKCPHCSAFHLTKMTNFEHKSNIKKARNSFKVSDNETIMDKVAKRLNFLKNLKK